MEVSWKERGLLLEVFLEGEYWRLVPKAGFLPLLTSVKKRGDSGGVSLLFCSG